MRRPALRQITAELSPEARGCSALACGVTSVRACGKRGEAAVVVDVEMGEDDQLDVARRDPERAQLRSGLLLRRDLELHCAAEIGMSARQAHAAGVGAASITTTPSRCSTAKTKSAANPTIRRPTAGRAGAPGRGRDRESDFA